MNIVIVAGVVVLLLLLVKMRKDRAVAAKPAKPAKAEKSRGRAKRKDAKVAKGTKQSRRPASIEAAVSESAATVAPEAPQEVVPEAPQEVAPEAPADADPSGPGDWIEDLVETPEPEQAPAADQAPVSAPEAPPAPEWNPSDVVDEPGWPAPGEMDGGWSASMDETSDFPTVDISAAQPAPEVAAAVDESADGDGWDPDAEFDPAAGWGDEAEEQVAATVSPTADADANAGPDGEAVDWDAHWAEETSAATTVEASPDVAAEAEPVAEDDTAWDAPWGDDPVADADEAPAAEVVTDAPAEEAWDAGWPADEEPVEALAAATETAKVEETPDWAGEWAGDDEPPAPHPVAADVADWGSEWGAASEEDESPWDIAASETAVVVAPEAPVVEQADEIFAAFESADDDQPESPADAHRATDERLAMLLGTAPAPEPHAEASVDGEVDKAVVTFRTTAPDAYQEPDVADEVWDVATQAAFEEPEHGPEPVAFDEPAESEARVAEAVTALAPEVADAPDPTPVAPGLTDPLSQWSALSPAVPGPPPEDLADRWATLAPRPTDTAPRAVDPVARWAAITPIAPTASAPARERGDDAVTGRFALGGFALQGGHQVVTGVTFRFAADHAPQAWVLGPCAGATPGTLILDVEGALNCTETDVEVLFDEGFGPTTNGFTLRLTAPEGGPFAASGSYRLA